MEKNAAGEGEAWFAVGPSVKRERGVPPGWGWWEGNGGALCIVDCRLVHGYADAREAVGGEGHGSGGWAWRGKRDCGKGRAVVPSRRITLRKGAAGWTGGRARRGKGDCGKGGAVVSPRRITLRKGARGARARRGKEDGGKGRAVVSPWRITWKAGARGGRAAGRRGGREPARRKNAGQKEKGGRGRLTCGIWSSAGSGSHGRAVRRA